MNSNAELKLICQLQNDYVRAFDKLYYLYGTRIYKFAFSLLKNKEDSEGIVQEVFLRIWKNRKKIDKTKSFKSYLFSISYNLIIDQLRNRLKEKEYLGQLEMYFDKEMITAANEVDYNIIKTQIDKAVEELPEKRKQIYKLSRVNGLSHKEISEKLNISAKTVENQINLALKHLKRRLGTESLAILLYIFLFA